jgi:hypothetical protein
MKDRVLIPCTACTRHVLSDERSCPFCGAARDATPAADVKRTLIPRGTSRAAAFALRAALVTATAGCAANHDGDDEPGAEAGASPDAMAAADAGAARDAAPEASAAADAAPDAEDEDAFVPIPIYGGVFPDPRTRAKV